MEKTTITDQTSRLRELGYTGPVDQGGRVRSDAVALTADQAAMLTQRLLDLLGSMQPTLGEVPRFWLMTTNRKTHAVEYRWFLSRPQQADALRIGGIVAAQRPKRSGGKTTKTMRYAWGAVPPKVGDLTELPTRASVKAWPEWFISGPGGHVAEAMPCPHQYYLTDSCPGCDADEDDASEV